ncbi:hypothetical protein [Fundidesulfovibrio butyratiphilus]
MDHNLLGRRGERDLPSPSERIFGGCFSGRRHSPGNKKRLLFQWLLHDKNVKWHFCPGLINNTVEIRQEGHATFSAPDAQSDRAGPGCLKWRNWAKEPDSVDKVSSLGPAVSPRLVVVFPCMAARSSLSGVRRGAHPARGAKFVCHFPRFAVFRAFVAGQGLTGHKTGVGALFRRGPLFHPEAKT